MNWAWRFSIENPYLLPLLVAGLFPVVLHWLDRRRARVVEWAAVRFLVPRNRGRVRRLQRLEGLGPIPSGSTPAHLTEIMRNNTARWSGIVTESGYTIDK